MTYFQCWSGFIRDDIVEFYADELRKLGVDKLTAGGSDSNLTSMFIYLVPDFDGNTDYIVEKVKELGKETPSYIEARDEFRNESRGNN